MKLYKSLILPAMEFDAAVSVSILSECCMLYGIRQSANMSYGKSIWLFQERRLTRGSNIDLHLKLRRAQKVVNVHMLKLTSKNAFS